MYQLTYFLRGIVGGMVLCFMGLGCGNTESLEQADVIMLTDLGEVHIQLYDATPIHKKNFLKLASSGFYDGMAFHRVIYDFMIQVGDPRTKTEYPVTDADAPDGPGYTLAAEIVDSLIHIPGQIGAARWPDEENPERRSSGSQFYIITGAPVAATTLDSNEVVYTGVKRGEFFQQYQTALDSGEFSGGFETYLKKQKFQDFHYPQTQRNTYYQEGGAPWLDFQYTIFGRVLKGMDIVQRIEVSPCDAANRPKAPIRILQMKIAIATTTTQN
ncbi:MAG: peptidylprolyl isomerase [Bacteroidota bacterium]